MVAGAGALDLNVALTARDHALAGLEFLSGIPGTIGGAFPTNAGAYGGELAEVLVSAEIVDRSGTIRTVTPPELGLSYRHSTAPADWIFTSARLRGVAWRSARHRSTHRRDRSGAGGDPAAQPHRRLDLRQPAQPQGVGADRPLRLPRAADRRCAGFREALQLPDQSRRGDGGGHRIARRGGAQPRLQAQRRAAAVGDQAHRRDGTCA